MHAKSLADPRGSRVAAEIGAAADRALDESRRAIAALTRPLDEPLGAVLADVGEEVARREGVELDLVVLGELDVSPDTREELVRMVRNAIIDAGQRRGATRVRIELANGRLRISHDGDGSDPGSPETAGSRTEIAVRRP
jgi:signal transduction histidine kinase